MSLYRNYLMLLRVYSTRVQATIRRIKNNNTRNNNNNNNTRPDQIFPFSSTMLIHSRIYLSLSITYYLLSITLFQSHYF